MDPEDLRSLVEHGAKGIERHALVEKGTCEPDEPLAVYKPAASRPRIIYFVKRISDYADATLADILNHLGIRRVGKDVIDCWRFALLSFIRRHELFHYLVERGARLHAEGKEMYKQYRERVYGPRYGSSIGNLEEALAEAYAAAWCEDELHQTFKEKQEIKVLPIDSLCRDLKMIFVEVRRVPGYKEARHFLDEMKKLRSNTSLPPVSLLSQPELLYDEDLAKAMLHRLVMERGLELWYVVFEGLAWLFNELYGSTPSPFVNEEERENPPRPFSAEQFIAFLVNIQYLRSALEMLLPQPIEEPA